MNNTCVIGWPISHSRSPLIHNYWRRQLGIGGTYTIRAVEPQDLPSFLRSFPGNGFVGCNITIPHKETAIELVDAADARARRVGAINTVWLEDGKTHATTSDGEGFLNNLFQEVPGFGLSGKTAVVLGAGGSARAVVDGLLEQEMRHVRVVNRTAARARELAAAFGSGVVAAGFADLGALLQDCDLLVNTTSLGMKGQPKLEIDLLPLPERAVVADIVYVPLLTPLLESAHARGLRIVPGLGMLLHQAVCGFQHWHGVRPRVTNELYDLVARDIDPAYVRP